MALVRPRDEVEPVASITAGIERDRYNRPLIKLPHPDDRGKTAPYTRTTTFIDCLDDKSNLAKWKARMTLIGASGRPDVVERVPAIDPESKEGKDKLNELVEKLQTSAGAHIKSEKGSLIHEASEYIDRGEPIPVHLRDKMTDQDFLDLDAYCEITKNLQVSSIEQFCVNDELMCAGTADRIVFYSGPGPYGEPVTGFFIADTKTSKDPTYNKLKMAMQLAVYANSSKYDPETGDRSPLLDLAEVSKDLGIIISIPQGTGKGQLYWCDLKLGYEAAQLALSVREIRKVGNRKGTMLAFSTEV